MHVCESQNIHKDRTRDGARLRSCGIGTKPAGLDSFPRWAEGVPLVSTNDLDRNLHTVRVLFRVWRWLLAQAGAQRKQHSNGTGK